MTAAPELDMERLELLRHLEIAESQGKWWKVEPHQVAPDGDWYLWLLLAGRGSGKTWACANYFDEFMRKMPGARGGIIAPTIGDAFQAPVYGPSGLLVINPAIRVLSRGGGTEIRWPNGSVAHLFGTNSYNDVHRLRAGGNRHIYWCEELAAWRYLQEAWEEGVEYGLRLGARPRVIASTTPRTRPFLKKLMLDDETVITRASTFDNPNLPAEQRDRLRRKYENTRLGRQELFGEFIEEVEGALWTFETLEATRVAEKDLPDMERVVVAVDPSGGDSEGNDEQGIIVVGRGVDGDGYVIADYSCKLSPDGWGRRAVQAYIDHKADRIVCEGNFGGDMVISTVQVAAKAMGAEVATKKISASRGKVARAEPVSALYEQKRAHNVDGLVELEEQQRFWTPSSGWSPDRMDAAVWGLTEVMLGSEGDPIPMKTFVPRGRIMTQNDRFSPIGGI